MTQSARLPSAHPTDIPPLLAQAREAAGAAIDAAAMGREGLQLLEGLLGAICALGDAPGHAAAIAHAGQVIAEFYLGPLESMYGDASALADELSAREPGAGGAA